MIRKKEENKEKKLKEGETLILCKDKSSKPNGKCSVAIGLKQCIIGQSVLKPQCGKKTCRSPDGSKPLMTKLPRVQEKSLTI